MPRVSPVADLSRGGEQSAVSRRRVLNEVVASVFRHALFTYLSAAGGEWKRSQDIAYCHIDRCEGMAFCPFHVGRCFEFDTK